ncbi:MAG: DUF4258 domain-containing protein [Campylobacterales bacterium]|nr:DUF4258 domain-containing protein [Campylobacterales bacterium]
MTDIFSLVKKLVLSKNILVSSHGYDELAEDGIYFKDLISSISDSIVVEDYPNAWKGPTVLLLQKDRNGNPVHSVWGIPKGKDQPAVLITAYIPDPNKWDESFTRRKNGQ